jgi:hypothetical protein
MKISIIPRTIFQIILYSLTYTSAFADNEAIGNGAGEALSAVGPRTLQINLSECKFSITLEDNQYIEFNDPDIVFYEKNSTTHTRKPYLWQAETTSGYNWQFRTDGDTSTYWFGIMCAGTSEFLDDFSGKKTEASSLELDLIRKSNETHCPATYADGNWHPNHHITNLQNYIFQEVNGENWSGFAMGFKSSDGKEFSSLKFCLVHQNKVLIGASESDSPLSLPEDSFHKLLQTLSKIKFIELTHHEQ